MDCTFGRGGHSRAILECLGTGGRLLVFDKDPEAVACAREIASRDPRVECIRSGFGALGHELEQRGICGRVDGIFFDLGVSSPQLEDARRGFSFVREGELDMRMDPDSGIGAAEWINRAGEKEIARVLFEYGEERHSRRIARAIVRARQKTPITGTTQLAEIVAAANPSWEKDKHPATRSFQGIRIYINNELEELRTGLSAAFDCLRIGGRLLVISFHSLEDRIVKRFLRDLARYDPYPRDLPVPAAELQPRLRLVGKLTIPGEAEVRQNPRARSARLRIGEKLAS